MDRPIYLDFPRRSLNLGPPALWTASWRGGTALATTEFRQVAVPWASPGRLGGGGRKAGGDLSTSPLGRPIRQDGRRSPTSGQRPPKSLEGANAQLEDKFWSPSEQPGPSSAGQWRQTGSHRSAQAGRVEKEEKGATRSKGKQQQEQQDYDRFPSMVRLEEVWKQ